jgi:hypothetical protein
MRILRRLCADAHSAQLRTMRRCAFGLYDARIRILRILCADAQMRLCAYYAHIICRCAYYADMLILCAYYPYMFILFVLQIKHSPPLLTYTDPRKWWDDLPAPALIHCKTYYKSSILPYYTDPTSNHTPSPTEGGRRTSPACGSFRRPLNYNAGMN